MSKNKFPSGKAVLVGGALLAGYMYLRSKQSSEEGLPQGSLGGEDDLLGQQGFDVDPNSIPEQPTYPIYQITPEGETQPAQPVPVNNSNGGMSYAPPISTPKGSTFDPYALVLGAAGFSGSYFTGIGTTFGKNVAKYGDESLSFWKRVYKEGTEAIPFAGQQATKFVAEEVAETGAKGLIKRAAKTGVSLIPVAGTVAGAEFDVRYSGKPRPLAYTANIFGDIVGGGGAVLGAALGGVGSVGGAVGGQILGEQIVYKGASYAQDYASFAVQSVQKTVSRVSNVVTGGSSSNRSNSSSSANMSVAPSSSSSSRSSSSSSSRVSTSSNVSSANMSVAPSSSRSSSSAPRTSVGTVLSTASRGVSTAASSVRTAVQSTISRVTSIFRRKKK